MKQPTIAITTGEPAGIGPDICVLAAQQDRDTNWVFIGDKSLLKARAKLRSLPLVIHEYHSEKPAAKQAGHITVLHVPLNVACKAGTLSIKNASYVLEILTTATQGCIAQQFSAMVTAPVHKGIINDAGIHFSGHTEFLAELTHTPKVVMMLASKAMRVALVTTHLPLSAVPAAITQNNLSDTLRILHADLISKFKISNPKILVAGLNPHAGEDGHLGREEIEVITPVLESLKDTGMNLIGPLPADTLFTQNHLAGTDAVLAMYHDQGLPVLKHASFGEAINITLGLPIIRTSVDHGTALDLAGSGDVNIGSLLAAINTASSLAS